MLGKVFKLMNRPEVTESLYTQVTQMWYNFLRRLLQTRVVFTDMDAILGRTEEEQDDGSTSSNKLGTHKTKSCYDSMVICFSH